MIRFLRQPFLLASLSSGILCWCFAAAARSGEYMPQSGQPGKDVVWVPSPPAMIEKLLDLAAVTPRDFVIDLGSGDGRAVMAAAKRGARAHGIEYDADLVALSRRAAVREGVSERATFEQGDVFKSDFTRASVIVLFLTPEMNMRLRPKLLGLKPGARIVANTFGIGDWNADRTASLDGNCERWCTARLWIVPANVSGVWKMPAGELTLKQVYQTFAGSLKDAGVSASVTGRLQGENIFFASTTTRFTGRVNGDLIEGIARTAGTDIEFRAARVRH
jgi:SAM-dependent methyltransferase